MTRRVVTVFGGSGFIGRHLVRRLAREGAIVRVAVRDIEAAMFLKPMGDIGQIVMVPTNITDPVQVADALAGADEAVNLVGLLSEWGNSTFQRIHAEAARTVAEAVAAGGIKRLVHMSAIGADTKSASRYARTKAAGEAAAKAAFPNVTIIRPSVVFGPEDKFFNMFASLTRFSPVLPVFGCPTIPKVNLCACEGRQIGIDFYGDGGTRMQPIFVGDVTEAICRALGDGDTAGCTFELAGAEVFSFKQLMELTLAACGRKRLLVPVPFLLASFWAWFLEKWPTPLLTCDQVTLLKSDNIADGDMPGLAELGITPVSVQSILPTYLHRFRPQTYRAAKAL
ncbi:MAG: complex I NDUFA9 subunit family protein [Alphaproteobacteria bacterium]